MDIALEQFLTDYNNGVFDAPSTSNQPETNQQPQPTIHTPLTNFCLELALARYAKRMSQAELARRIGAHQSTIARIECGKANPSITTVLKIAQALTIKIVFMKVNK